MLLIRSLTQAFLVSRFVHICVNDLAVGVSLRLKLYEINHCDGSHRLVLPIVCFRIYLARATPMGGTKDMYLEDTRLGIIAPELYLINY